MSSTPTNFVVPTNTASSESTPNYHFPIFVANDKPSWLGSWNTAMTQIDNTLKEIDTKGGANKADIDNLKTSVETAQNAITALQETEGGQAEKVNKNTADIAANTEKINNMAQDLITQNGLIKQLSETVLEIQSKIASLETVLASVNIKMLYVGDVKQVSFPKYASDNCKLVAVFGDSNYGNFFYTLNNGDYTAAHNVSLPMMVTGADVVDADNAGGTESNQPQVVISNNFEISIAENDAEESSKTITFTAIDSVMHKSANLQTQSVVTQTSQTFNFRNAIFALYGKVSE